MKAVTIFPFKPEGCVTVPPSKSAAHRNIICAALSGGISKIYPSCHSRDIDATINCVKALGAEVTEKEGAFFIKGINPEAVLDKKITLDCDESGSTLRFMIPLAAALGANATFIGRGRLPSRPITPITDVLRAFGVSCSADALPLTIKGKLKVGKYPISGNISSQYLTGLLFAAALNGGEVMLTTPLESAGYVDLTMSVLKKFGINTTVKNGVYSLNGTFSASDRKIEGDWSQCCFYLAAAALGGNMEIKGLDFSSTQGDMAALEIFKNFGADIKVENDTLYARGNKLNALEVDCSQIPDMVPALAVTAAMAKGTTRLFGAQRLKIKESNRIKTVVDGLNAMGISVAELSDGMLITGGTPKGGTVDGANDHRIVMAFSVLAAFAKGETKILGYDAINKSYPTFFEDFKRIGGDFKCHL